MVEITRKKRFIFNPDEETKEMLIATFAIRKELFNKIFRIIKSSATDTAPQHFLLIGQRGMGKTTLLLRLKYEMEDDTALKNYLIPVRFSEEQYQIGCLPDLWEETAMYLESQQQQFAGLKDEMLKHEKENDYERICFSILTEKLKQANKRIVLLIDNIGDLFNKLTEQENHRFREILMTSPHIQLIGASSHMLEHTFKYDKPFFEFFYQLKLEPINKKDATELMRALAENYDVYNKIEKIIKEKPERIEVMRRITGGVPRTLVLLFEILVDSDNGNAFEDLEELTDRVSPLYKERMDILKPQQQKIMDALARAWEPITASEVLEQSKLYRENLASNQVSAQLKQLEDNQLAEAIDLGKRKKAYRIRERFFNIWYLMRHGRKNTKEQVLWLIRFLESWCTMEELKEMASNQIECMKNDRYSTKAAFYKALALHEIRGVDPDLKKELLKHTEDFLTKTKKEDWAKTIHSLSENVEGTSFLEEATSAFDKGDTKKAEEYYLKAIDKGSIDALNNLAYVYYKLNQLEKAEEYCLKAIDKGSIHALYNLANLYKDLKQPEKAEEYYLKAIDKGDINALYNLANLYKDLKQPEKAEEYYLKAIDKGNINALYNLAILYTDLKQPEKAEEYYLKAIDKGDINALNNLAILYEDLKQPGKAEEYYLKAIDKGDIDALNNLAILYEDLKQPEKAEEYYLKAIDKEDVEALFNLANLYKDLKQPEKSEEYYLKAINKGNIDALFNLALLYGDLQQPEKAEEYYLKAINKGSIDALNNLAGIYYKLNQLEKAKEYCLKAIDKGNIEALFNLAMVYEDLQQPEKAEEYYLKAINKGSIDALNNLAGVYFKLNQLEKAEEYCLEAIDKGNIEALFNLAMVYEDLKQLEKSEEYYLKAIYKGNIHALYNLANLYKDLQQPEKAEEYYLKAIDKGNIDALYNLANLYKDLQQPEKAEEYYSKAIEMGNFMAAHNLAVLQITHKKLNKALELCIRLFEKEEYLTEQTELALLLLLKLLELKQYNFLLKEFKKEDSLLLKYMQPVYYALAWFMKDELPGEYEKAGTELKETVDEIIKTVEKGRKKSDEGNP